MVTSDPEWIRLNDVWSDAGGQAKAHAYGALSKHQDSITGSLLNAVVEKRLPVIALTRSRDGTWAENQLPHEYWESFGGDLALWTGSAWRLGLPEADRWLDDAPLCFRRAEFDRWLSSRGPGPEPVMLGAATFWSAIQAVEWIATRDVLAVARADSDQREDALYRDDVREDVVKSLAFHRILEEDTFQPPVVWRRDALELLVEACRSGTVEVFGLERGSGESVQIPATAWVHRTIADSRHGVACRSERPFADVNWWNHLRFEVARIQRLWPVPGSIIRAISGPVPSFSPQEVPAATPFSLDRLACCLRPRWGHAWLLAQDCAAGQREAERIRIRIAKRHPTLLPRHRFPLQLSEQVRRRVEIDRRARSIFETRLKPALMAVMGSPDWTVRALDAQNNEVEVPSRLVSQLVLDLKASSLSLQDGSVTWRGVTVERKMPAAALAPTIQSETRPAFASDEEIIVLVRPVIDAMVSDARQLRKSHFPALLRELFGGRLPPKANERLWPVLAPLEWRLGGKRADGTLIDDWRAYLKPKAKHPQT